MLDHSKNLNFRESVREVAAGTLSPPAYLDRCPACNGAFDQRVGHKCKTLDYGVTDIPPPRKPLAFEVDSVSTKLSNPKDAISDTKLPLWLLSPIAKAHWALAQFAGMLKYGAWNWRVAGVRYSVYISAMQRHLDGIVSGETLDPIDGTDHLGNIMACAAIILDARAAAKLTDDRPPVVGHRETYKNLEALMAKLRAQYADRTPTHYSIEDTPAT